MSTNIGSNSEDTEVKKVLALLNPSHYQSDMWEIALKLNIDEIEILKDYSNQLRFIAEYSFKNSKVIK